MSLWGRVFILARLGQKQHLNQTQRQRTGVSALHGLTAFWRWPYFSQSFSGLCGFGTSRIALDYVL
jgi:hypothetical protein